jgi:hypothetical protein
MTHEELEICLDRRHTINLEIHPDGPLPEGNHTYDALRDLPETGFSFTPRELLHAIGCKTAALPRSKTDDCLRAALLYSYVLDLEGPYLSFQGDYGSDFQTSLSQAVGVGMMSLIAERYFDIPWDQLGTLPGPGKRFDYRGSTRTRDCIFESKGTSHRGNQEAQIQDGLAKKEAHHARAERFDAELVVSSFVGHGDRPPRLLIADPDKSSLRKLYDRGGDRYYRLKHYCRVLQFVGLPRSAYLLNIRALDYLNDRRSIYKTIIDEKEERGYLTPVYIAGDEFLGRWFDTWVPEGSSRYGHLEIEEELLTREDGDDTRRVFQGMRRDVYEAGLQREPFAQPLLDRISVDRYREYESSGVSVFPDGTVMIFHQT